MLDKKWSQEVLVDVVLLDELIEVEMDLVDECKVLIVEIEQSFVSEKFGLILDCVGFVYENFIFEFEVFFFCGKVDELMEWEVVCIQMELNDVNEIVFSILKNFMLVDLEFVGERIIRFSIDL